MNGKEGHIMGAGCAKGHPLPMNNKGEGSGLRSATLFAFISLSLLNLNGGKGRD
jgi:hypothetical protein